MHSHIIDVRANAVRDVEAISHCLGALPEVLLLVANEMFCASDDARALDTLNSLGYQDSRENRVGARRSIQY